MSHGKQWTAAEMETAKAMRLRGHSFQEIGDALARTPHAIQKRLADMGAFYRRPPRQAPPRTEKEDSGTICWDCRKATGHCAWSRSFQPIPGWRATPVYPYGLKTGKTSYVVRACPAFERDKKAVLEEKEA